MVKVMANINDGFECIEFSDYEDLAEEMLLDENKLRVAVLPYYHAIELVREFLSYDDVDIDYLEYDNPVYNEYRGDYYVSLDEDDKVSIEPCYRDGRFILAGGDILYIFGDSNSEILTENASEFNDIFEINFVDEDDLADKELDATSADAHSENDKCSNGRYVGESNGCKMCIDGKLYTMAKAVEFVNDWLKVMDEI